MKIYLAARFSRRHILQGWQRDLEGMGHQIVSRWSMRGSNHIKPVGLSERAADAERERFAREDIEDIHACDCVISLMEEERKTEPCPKCKGSPFTERPCPTCEGRGKIVTSASTGRGGRHVEFGYALALGKRLVIIGDRETVFHHLPQVEQFQCWEQAQSALFSESRRAGEIA